jgi:tRNA1(Val) A37 N6-methylase TrmN6
MTYRNATTKEEKREMERLIESIKSDFATEVAANDKRLVQLKKLNGDLFNLTRQTSLFERTRKEIAAWNKQVNELTVKIKKLEKELEELKSNKIFENAFEWRFEFPEVLNDDGDFVGFDVVIGNPPYGVNFSKKSGQQYENLYHTFNLRGESYTLFIERAVNLLQNEGQFGFIIPDTLLNLGFTEAIRSYLIQNVAIHEIDLLPTLVFPGASVNTILLFFKKQNLEIGIINKEVSVKFFRSLEVIKDLENPQRSFKINPALWQNSKSFNIQSDSGEIQLINRIDANFHCLGEFCDLYSGIKAYEVGKGNPPQTSEILNSKPFTSKMRKNESWLPLFDGKHIGFYELLWHEDNWIDYGEWLAAPREKQNFDSEKILIRKITGSRLIAHYIPYTSYCNTLLFVLKIRPEKAKITYKALLGILNSRFLGWYFRKKFQINREDTFPQIMIRDILQFAIPNVHDARTKKIEQLVDEIISIKHDTQSADTSSLENKIDCLVYELYGLTEDEIRIVEGT